MRLGETQYCKSPRYENFSGTTFSGKKKKSRLEATITSRINYTKMYHNTEFSAHKEETPIHIQSVPCLNVRIVQSSSGY